MPRRFDKFGMVSRASAGLSLLALLAGLAQRALSKDTRPALLADFGPGYEAYRASVPRWLGVDQ